MTFCLDMLIVTQSLRGSDRLGIIRGTYKSRI